jgi:hypothetical protein
MAIAEEKNLERRNRGDEEAREKHADLERDEPREVTLEHRLRLGGRMYIR